MGYSFDLKCTWYYSDCFDCIRETQVPCPFIGDTLGVSWSPGVSYEEARCGPYVVTNVTESLVTLVDWQSYWIVCTWLAVTACLHKKLSCLIVFMTVVKQEHQTVVGKSQVDICFIRSSKLFCVNKMTFIYLFSCSCSFWSYFSIVWLLFFALLPLTLTLKRKKAKAGVHPGHTGVPSLLEKSIICFKDLKVSLHSFLSPPEENGRRARIALGETIWRTLHTITVPCVLVTSVRPHPKGHGGSTLSFSWSLLSQSQSLPQAPTPRLQPTCHPSIRGFQLCSRERERDVPSLHSNTRSSVELIPFDLVPAPLVPEAEIANDLGL